MTRNLKALGLALVAVLAMGALAAQAAQAIDHTFKSNSGSLKTTLTGENEAPEVFSVGGGKAKLTCTTAKFEGTAGGELNDTVTITPTYGSTTATPSGCTDGVSGKEAIIHTNHCAYEFESDTDANGDAPVTIECAAGESIEVTLPGIAPGITLKIGAQTPTGGVNYTNLTNHPAGSGREAVTVKSTVSKIKYTCAPAASAFCIVLPGNDGTYNGETTLTGYKNEGTIPTDTTKTTPGATSEVGQVDVTLTTP